MREIEVKVLDIDKNDIEKKLISLGANLIKNEHQTNIRFDTDDNTLKTTLNAYLRVRQTKNLFNDEIVNTLTLKKNISRDSVRINEEIETEISNFDETAKIMEILGYKRKRPGFKHRKSYIYENMTFEIDQWDEYTYSKPYLEIEVMCEEDLEKALKLLNIDKSSVTTKSIDELKKE